VRAYGPRDDRRANRSDSANDEPGDEIMITCANKTAGTDIQLMGRGLNGDELRSIEVAAENGGSGSIGGESEGRAVAII
jgi:hypothetical protein